MQHAGRCWLAILLILLIAGQASAFQVFVWRHDNNLRFVDPVYGQSYTATEPVLRALNELNIDWDSSATLPSDLSDYDVVVTCLAYLCPG